MGVGVGGYSYLKPKTAPRPEANQPLAETPTPAAPLATWTDEAGFSIQYPKNLSVNQHIDDNVNYAHLELTNSDRPGKIIVWVKDVPSGVTDLSSWVASDPTYTKASVIDTTLGGQPAKKILATAPVKMYTVGTISDNLLFYVEGTLTDDAYWRAVEDGIVGSFAFTPDTSQSAVPQGNAAAPSADSADETETLQ